jgi:uncharacterized membrane protein YkoI
MLALAAVILFTAVVGIGHGDYDHEEAYRLRERREILRLEELLRRLDLGAGTRILEIERKFEHGRHVYEIEYLNRDGRVREALIDAGTGDVLGEQEDD